MYVKYFVIGPVVQEDILIEHKYGDLCSCFDLDLQAANETFVI